MNNFYNKDITSIYLKFDTSINGLKKEMIEASRRKYGSNEIIEKEKKSKPRVFLEQFQDVLVVILLSSAVIAGFIGEIESSIVIFAVLILNAVLGTYQHFKAEKSLDSLKSLSNPVVSVIRDGKSVFIPSKDVVVGDIVNIKVGNYIPADGRIITCNDFEINESALTGESMPVEKTSQIINNKNILINDQKNMVFSGTFCDKGNGQIVICRVGMNSELGKIADLMTKTKNKRTPLQIGLDNFSTSLAVIIIIICLLVFVLNIYRHINIIDSLMFAVALAVAAIPEALSTIVVIVLAIGTERMANENAIIKELKAVESLGCVNVICTDKTGTLTMNKMQVKEVQYYGDKKSFLRAVAASLNDDNATEVAIMDYLMKENYVSEGNRLSEVAFSSSRKMMSALHNIGGENILFSKGAAEAVIKKVKYIKTPNAIKIMNKVDVEYIYDDITNLSKKGFRVIVFAFRDGIYKDTITEDDERDLVYTGHIALIDPLRMEAKDSVRDCLTAGIKPIMLTGDHKETAMYIAGEVGIYKTGDIALTSDELKDINDIELQKIVPNVTVYARLTPADKIRIVSAWQKRQAIVAMTGDGINDAPALKQADVGISMGRSGTQVAKDASSLILIDDNFATIIKAVLNGRNVYQNIQNAIRFLLSGNFAAILLVLYTIFFNLPIPFVAVHLLFINLLTDSLPAIAIGMEVGNNGDLLKKKPRRLTDRLLNNRLIMKVGIEGVLIAIFTLLSYYEGLKISANVARSMTFTTLCIARLFHSFNCVRARSILITGLKNTYLILSFLIGMVLINMVIFIPELRDLLSMELLTAQQIYSIYAYAILPTFILQAKAIIKYI